VLASGATLFLGAVLPWTTFDAHLVDGSEGRRDFSGWSLAVDCAAHSFPGQCVFEDPAIGSELVPVTIATGEWAMLSGLLLGVVGVLALVARSGRRPTWLLASGWCIALAASGCAAGTLAEFIGASGSNGGGGDPSVGVGLVIAAIAPSVAMLGLVLLQVSGRDPRNRELTGRRERRTGMRTRARSSRPRPLGRRSVAGVACLGLAVTLCSCSNGESTRSAARPRGTLSGRLVAQHGAGLVIVGEGPVAGTVEVRSGSGRPIATVQSPTRGFSVRLPVGTYTVSASIADGSCTEQAATVTSAQRSSIALACQDGYSTF
jgi:hypothetical protein